MSIWFLLCLIVSVLGDPNLRASNLTRPANLKGISIYGLETNLRNTVCSWVKPATYYLEKLHAMGFNTIRIPLSIQYMVENDFTVLDKMVEFMDANDMQWILDVHRVGNDYQQANPDVGIKEYSGVSDRDELANQVIKVIARYTNHKSLIGTNTWNEYTGMDAAYKREWDSLLIGIIEQSFPMRLIYFLTGLNWSGVLTGFSMEDHPLRERIIYGVHKYHFSGSGHRDDWEGSFGNTFPPEKINIGEFGFRNPEDLEFGREFVAYLIEKKIKNWQFWTIAHSGDTGGLWYDDCVTLDQTKLAILQPLLDA